MHYLWQNPFWLRGYSGHLQFHQFSQKVINWHLAYFCWISSFPSCLVCWSVGSLLFLSGIFPQRNNPLVTFTGPTFQRFFPLNAELTFYLRYTGTETPQRLHGVALLVLTQFFENVNEWIDASLFYTVAVLEYGHFRFFSLNEFK